MKSVVLYRPSTALPCDPPSSFSCEAKDTDHAEDQCEASHGNVEVLWVCFGMTVEETYQNYYNIHPWES